MKRLGLLLLLCCLAQTAPGASSLELAQAMQRLEGTAELRVKERFEEAGVAFPPDRIQLIALKESRKMELWAYADRQWRYIHDYPIFAASGEAGPKLREGDKQVPEGFYRIVELNPNSHFHLSMKLNYPNSFDWAQAAREGRQAPGSNIFIHGSAWSTGCLAVGNRYVEELFYLVGRVGMENAGVLIAPYDFRQSQMTLDGHSPAWVAELYGYLKLRLADFPLAGKHNSCEPGCREARVSTRLVN
jgi:hypothetical protein